MTRIRRYFICNRRGEMLSQEENELLTKVGPGTPMGELMRQYWIPGGLSSELPEPDCSPVRIMLLCEELVAFRDTDGKVGLLDNNCPHRRASLFFGRNEECGLRCVYHGWKFDVNGDCVDMPSEPAESNFKDKVKIKAYPVQERGGILWTYMGPRETPPALPELEPNMIEDYQIRPVFMRECNWMQALEGDIDTVHGPFLHTGALRPEDVPEGSWTRYQLSTRAAKLMVTDTDFGTMYGTYRPAEEDTDYWRIANFLFPFYTMIPQGVMGRAIHVQIWVPIDDTHTLHFKIEGGQFDTQPPGERNSLDVDLIPNGTGWHDRFRMVADESNDFQLDRTKQREVNYSGLPGVTYEDQAVTTTMGKIADRTKERLGTTDSMIIKTRRRLINAARDLMEGATPPGVDNPEVYGVRAGGIILPRDTKDWVEATNKLRAAWVHHPELDAVTTNGTPPESKPVIATE
jgi:phthalate 4,5-dioxygenase oxygenase subunit